jgi:uncharacterized protein (DUF58 family)
MFQSRFTIYSKTVLFLSLLLFVVGYLFINLLPALLGTFLLVFLVYTKQSFKQSIGDIAIQRTIIEQLRFVNHPVHVKTTIQNQGGVLIIHAQDILPEAAELLKGDTTQRKLVKPGDTITLDYQIAFTSRGTHHFDDVDIERTDRWNLYTTHTTQSHKTELLVHSDPEEIQKAQRVSSREPIEITLPALTGIETSYEMEGIREYIPGDQLRDIDWKATSRLQKHMTRLYQKKQNVETMLLLDCSKNMRRTTGKNSKLEHATVLAIHLTKILQSLHHTVGLITYDENKTLQNIEPTMRYTTIFETLATIPTPLPTQGYTPPTTTDASEIKQENPKENQRFLTTVYPFLARGKRTITHPTQASGIYEATRILFRDTNSKHLIIITDLETNLQALYRSILRAHAKKYPIWLLTFFSPTYNLDTTHLTPEELEHLYTLQESREKILHKLKKNNIEIVNITPSTEGGKIIEEIRRQ